MGDLNQIVQFSSFSYNSRSHCGAVDRCVCSDLYLIFDDHVPDLCDFYVCTVMRGKAETISSDYRTRMDNTIFPDHAVMIDLYPGIQDRIISDRYVITNVNLRINFNIFSNFYIFTYVSERTYIYRLRNCCRRCNVCIFIDTFFFGTRLIY